MHLRKITRGGLLLAFGLLLTIRGSFGQEKDAPKKAPNVLLIVADDK